MERRQFVMGLMAASVSGRALLAQSQTSSVATPAATHPAAATAATPAPGPVPWMRGLLEVKPLPIGSLVPDAFATPSPKFFSDEQMATLRQLCEILLPPLKGFPGAVDAGAPEFLDFLISVSPEDRQQMYRSGLDRLERDAKRKCGVSFAAVTDAQADPLIRPHLKPWMTDHPPTEPFEQFLSLAHDDIRTATFNSKPWNDAAIAAGERPPGVGLYWYPVEADVEEKYLPRS
jgi:hypothetical protein